MFLDYHENMPIRLKICKHYIVPLLIITTVMKCTSTTGLPQWHDAIVGTEIEILKPIIRLSMFVCYKLII